MVCDFLITMLFNPPPRPLPKSLYNRDAESVREATVGVDSVKAVNTHLQPEVDWLFGQLSPANSKHLELRTPIYEVRGPRDQEGDFDSDEDTVCENDSDATHENNINIDTKSDRAETPSSRQSAFSFYSIPREPSEYRLNEKRAVTGIQIPAFCQDESPWKYLRRLRMLRSPTERMDPQQRSPPRVLITSTNLTLPTASLASAELFLPTQQRRRGRWRPSAGWTKIADTTEKREVITERNGRWYYLGTYAAVGDARMVDPRAFVSMAEEVRTAIYRETDEEMVRSVARMYGKGMLRAVKIRLECVGYNEELAGALARAVGSRQVGKDNPRAGRRSVEEEVAQR
ncbi:hypothetical protein NEOLEDRAFT_1140536 [Neolentinus lepideus HHB14362 ss-1]|uniref:DUF6697 domain-containing protein n=1 Tax=Neolentinus lepideus HHB14362 ss-1 TaxID=1314782 RepID=A0A165P5S7_9AGAM|nr:hypothetical protein NEOLEDRAFT_1140536 [Neolentinus lepideus HHB14362 ss-1]